MGVRSCRRADPGSPHSTVTVQKCKIKTNGTIWGGSLPATSGLRPPSIQAPPEHSLPLSPSLSRRWPRDLRPQQPLIARLPDLLNREGTGADRVSRPVFTGSLDEAKPPPSLAAPPPKPAWRGGERKEGALPAPHPHPSSHSGPGAAPRSTASRPAPLGARLGSPHSKLPAAL